MLKKDWNLKRIFVWVPLAMFLATGYWLNISAAEAADATKFPVKPITILNSSNAGSPADVMARQVGQHARKFLNQPLVVVNKTGGSGGVMFAALMSEPSDGYTICTTTSALITALHGDLKKDFSIDQFEFLANVQQEPFAFIVKAESPIKTLKDMIEYGKKNPRLKIGGQATFSAQHLMTLAFSEETGMPVSYVPYGGGSEVLTSLLGNHVPVANTSPATVNQYVESGKLRVLAISGQQRIPQWKNVPTLKELGYNIVVTQHRGFGAKKGLPSDVKAILVSAIKKAVAEPGFKDYMAKNFMQDAFMDSDEFTATVRADYEYMGKMMQKVVKK
jgi:tripartite-type tricarboxylate transporter receptor subunit TctC